MFPCCFPHTLHPLGHVLLALSQVRVRLKSVLLDQRPSLRIPADGALSLFEWFIGNMPLCDSSEAYARAVRPKPSPAVLQPGWTAGVSEVSRFSCMKFLGVSGVFDYAGPDRNSRYRSCPCCLPRITKSSASGFTVFGAGYPPRLYPCLRFAAYLTIGLAQNSGPSGSLLLSRKALSSSASCRFIPAHRNCLVAPFEAIECPRWKAVKTI